MNYKTLMGSSIRFVADQVVAMDGDLASIDIATFLASHERETYPGLDNYVDLSELEALIEPLEDAISTWTSKNLDSLEGLWSGKVHQSLDHLPVEVLDDPGFWQYLSVRYFLPYILWREKGSIGSGTLSTYLNASRSSEQIPLRMFIRGQIAGPDDDYYLAHSVKNGTDFWRSHIVRVSLGQFERVARGVIREQSSTPMSTTLLRIFAKIMNRQGSNTEMYMLGDDDAESLVDLSREQASQIVLDSAEE